jgi:Outer membrane protein beta-barrel domain
MNFFSENKRLEQKGWDKMSHLLDTEMPVEQKRRNYLPIWFFMLMAVPSSTLIGYSLGQSNARDSARLSSKPELELPGKTAISSYSTQVAHETTASLYLSNLLRGSTAVTKFLFVPSLSSFAQTGDDNTQQKNEAGQYVGPLHNSGTNQVAQTNTHITNAPKFNLPPYTPKTTKPKRGFRHWDWGIQGQIYTEKVRNFQIDGFSLGALVDYRLSRTWGLRSGLYYGQHTPTIKSQPLVKVYDWDYTQATGNRAVTPGNQAWGTADNKDPYVIIPVIKVHKIDMPIMAYWEPLRNFKTLAGLNLSYTAYAETAGYNFSDDKLLDINSRDLDKKVSRLASEVLEQWQAGAMTGLSYKPLKRLEIGATYNRLIDFKQLSKGFNSLESNQNFAKYSEQNFGGSFRPIQTFYFQTTLFF